MDALTPNEAKMLYEQQGAEISIPSNFATIESYAFSELPITKVNIPETINYIGDEAFRSTKLTTIDIPDSVTDIGESVFLWSDVSTISVGKTIEQSFLDQGVMVPKRNFLYGSYPTDVIIKDGTNIIGNGAFSWQTDMGDFNIHIPLSVETIGYIAFQGSGITSISLPGVKLIRDNAFHNSAITNVNFGDELTEISDDAFANTEISEINFPETLKHIGSRSFANTKLKIIDLKNVKSIGTSAFDTPTLEKAFISPKLERYIDTTQTRGAFLDSVIINNRSINQSEEDIGKGTLTEISIPERYKKKYADKITNFNPSTDALEIDTESFGINSSATFAAGINKREVKKLAKQDFDFLYDLKKGGLYFNENGSNKGFGDGGIIAILKGAPELTYNRFEFI